MMCCMVNGSLTERPFASGSTVHRVDPGGGGRAYFRKLELAPFLIKFAWRGEPRFQTSCVWSRSGNKKTRGCGNGKYVKGQDHVFPHPDGVLAQRRARAVAERRSQADRRGAECRDRRGRGR